MADTNEITVGSTVEITIAWREDEKPTAKNFFQGVVTEVIERSKHCFYVKLAGHDFLVPIDRAHTV